MKRTKSTSLQLFLFDNYLVVCKVKFVQQLEYYKLYQKVCILLKLYQLLIAMLAYSARRLTSFYTQHTSIQ